jgi:hypothetical protein
MRTFFGGLALGGAILVAAHAAALPVPVEADRNIEAAELRADATTGRAWIEVRLAKRFLSGKEARQHQPTRLSVAVPELSFDRASGQITIPSGDQRITCATVSGDDVRVTGACSIDARIEQVAVDTGFGTSKRDQLVVNVQPR